MSCANCTNLQTEKTALTNQVTALTNEKTGLTNQVTNLTNEKTALTNEKNALTNDKTALSNEKTALTNKVAGLEAEKTALTNGKTALTNQVTALTNEKTGLINQVTHLTNEKTALTNEKNVLTNQVTALTNEKNALTNQVTNLTNEKTALTNEKTALTDEKTNLKNQVAALAKMKNDMTFKVAELEDEKNNLQERTKASEDRVIQLEKEKNDLNSKFVELNSATKNTFEEKIAGLEAAIEAGGVQMQTEKKAFEEQKQSLEEKLRELEEDLQLEKDTFIERKKQLQEKIEQLQNEKESLEINLTDYASLKDQKNEADLKITVLEQELQKMNSIISGKQIYQYKITQENSQPFFDCCIAIDSLFCLTSNEKCWPIEFKDKKQYQEKSKRENSGLILGIMGNEKTGKGFVLSKLTGEENFPQGQYDKKKGIHVLYPNEKSPWTILEVSRGNGSIKMEEIKSEVEEYMMKKEIPKEDMMSVLVEDSHMTENLAQEFVAQNCHVLVITVGRLRREDQELIVRAKNSGAKKLLVIHNYSDVQSPEVVKGLVDVDIRRNPNIKPESSKEEPYLYWEKDNSVIISHLVMAHEGSEAGEYYNRKTIEHAKQAISGAASFPDQFDFVDAFEKHLKDNYKRYVSSHITPKENLEIIVKANQNDDQQSCPQGFRLGGQYMPKIKRENLAEDMPSLPFTLRSVTRDDDVINRDSKIGPKDFIEMELETVGACDLNNLMFELVDAKENQKQIVVQGKIEQNKKEGKIIENTRRLGEFKIVTKPFKLDDNKIVNIIEAPESRQNSGSDSYGLTVLSWSLGTKVTSYNQQR